MAVSVDLKELILSFEGQGDESQAYVNQATGEVVVVSDSLLRCAESDETPDLLDWQKDEWTYALAIVQGDDWVRAPSKFDIHEWQIMKDFALTVRSDRVRDELETAIHGRGAFRMFKAVLAHHKMFEAWDSFHEAALREIAIDWCDENKLAWHD